MAPVVVSGLSLLFRWVVVPGAAIYLGDKLVLEQAEDVAKRRFWSIVLPAAAIGAGYLVLTDKTGKRRR